MVTGAANRDEGREEKAACKAGDEKSRPECRQDKRDTSRKAAATIDEKTETPAAGSVPPGE